ncbi:MAG: hypothetical protein A3K19_14600 [Lentisphaerae bacterium RIFOXYB12_FULL_65_16]|nr:MAG: hypothetical protein A3K18_28665 [Lentisphaerae bacterium RIFOXYA12_64_32]OGV87452.1 MAG: hypothetical protein A3K19_14600 [Lentisphaerae bacterium RIFOXYB12_FULL_65_16]
MGHRCVRLSLWPGHVRTVCAAGLCLSLAGLFGGGCLPKKGAAGAGSARPPAKPVPVTVGTVVQKTMPKRIVTFGTVEAYATVWIKPMIAGQLQRVHIEPGQRVKKGDPLFSLDPKPFAATINQYEALLLRDQVQADEAQRQLGIANALLEKGVATDDEVKQARSRLDALQASITADKATIERAKIDRDYCTIDAPIDGRAGDLPIREGSVVKANETTMLVLAQTIPVYVTFAVPQVSLPEIRAGMAARKLPVTVLTPGDSSFSETGELSFIDNTVDETTGTIRLKATFANTDERLWPGQYVDLVLTLSEDPNAVVAPAQAIQTGQQGSYAFVVGQDQTASLRPVTIARTAGDEIIVASGLAPGETVVTDGQLRLIPGGKVDVRAPVSASREGQKENESGQESAPAKAAAKNSP